MLVFRNQTSYSRFWDGRNDLTIVVTTVRNLVRSFLTNSGNPSFPATPIERADTEKTVKVLIAIPYAVKTHLRAEWSGSEGTKHISPFLDTEDDWPSTVNPGYADLLPRGMIGHESEGLGLPLQLSFLIEAYIRRGLARSWWAPPVASQLQVQLHTLIAAYGRMETIRLTPMPVAHLIHLKQVLALFGCVLSFAMTDEMGWWAVLVVGIVTFALYGIEALGSQLEDPFGYDKIDIQMDAIVEDGRLECGVMLEEWRRAGKAGRELFEGVDGAGAGAGG